MKPFRNHLPQQCPQHC